MKAITKIWCNNNYVKNSVSGPNGGLRNSLMKEVSIGPFPYPHLLRNKWNGFYMIETPS